jgi:signal-transduction protein with cAMP-binding, CBS, and nucleotidyltransferase domain
MTDVTPATRIDPFPFQHRVSELMQTAAPALDRSATVQMAVDALAQGQASACVVLDDQAKPCGIITERDILRKVVAGGVALAAPATAVMSAPVATVPADAFVYVAIARMSRFGYRHLAVVEAASGRHLGLLDVRAVLRQRAMVALAIADEVAQATDWKDLKSAFERMPELGRSLRAEGVPAHQVAAVISGVVRDMTARAGELALRDMTEEGRGAAPAAWCLLVLGSGGRGESLLSADQDNALIHAGAEDDYPWFQEFGERVAHILNQAGIPFCRGGVMAAKRPMRHNLAGWQASISAWLERPEPEAILNADIFYDFAPVGGDFSLARQLIETSMRARNARLFLNLMAKEIGDKGDALGWFGRFKTKKGRVDLKIGGLFPIVAGARVLALRLGCSERSSRERWRAAMSAGIIVGEDLARLLDAHEMILGLILDQQLADLANGLPATSQVEVRRLAELEQDRLKEALQVVRQIDVTVRNALGEAIMRGVEGGAPAGRAATPEG